MLSAMKQRGIGGIDMALWLAALIGCMTFFFFYLLAARRKLASQTKIKARMLRLNRSGSPADQVRIDSEHLNLPFMERIIYPLLNRAEQHLIKLAPDHIAKMLSERIAQAGRQQRWSVNTFICIWVLSIIFFIGGAVFIAVCQQHLAFFQVLAGLLLAMFLGGALPLVVLDSLIVRRKKDIRRQLPEIMDLLCVSVQAGLSFDGAISKVVNRMQGPLVDECRKMLQDVRMGMARRSALKKMAVRSGVQEVELFAAAVIQAERLGVNLTKTLEVQAENMRERRRQAVKEQALKAPVKMLGPLVIFIFPPLFVVVLAPTLLSIMKNWGK